MRLTPLFITLSIALSALAFPLNDEPTYSLVSRAKDANGNPIPSAMRQEGSNKKNPNRSKYAEPPRGKDVVGPPLENGRYPPESLSQEYKDKHKLGAHLGNGEYLPRPPIGPDARRRDLGFSDDELLALRDVFDYLIRRQLDEDGKPIKSAMRTPLSPHKSRVTFPEGSVITDVDTKTQRLAKQPGISDLRAAAEQSERGRERTSRQDKRRRGLIASLRRRYLDDADVLVVREFRLNKPSL